MNDNDKIEIIKAEYELYDAEGVSSLNDLFIKIFDEIRDTTDYRMAFIEENRKNDIKLKAVRRLGEKLCKRMGILSLEALLRDKELVALQEKMADSFTFQLASVLRALDEDNFKDVNKLVCFTKDKCLENIMSVDELRKINAAADNGEVMERISKEETSTAMEIFFEDQLGEIVLDTIVKKKQAKAKSKAADKSNNNGL